MRVAVAEGDFAALLGYLFVLLVKLILIVLAILAVGILLAALMGTGILTTVRRVRDRRLARRSSGPFDR